MLENKFKTQLIKKIKSRFPDSIVIHLSGNDIQGIPDLLILYGKRWAALEGKKSIDSHRQPNQEFYISKMNEMSYASFVSPENEDEVLNDIQQSFES